jgi:hypothetical protein
MTTDPISAAQHKAIIDRLRRKGNRAWTGRRQNSTVRIWRIQEPAGVRIGYSISRRHLTVHGKEDTVQAAIRACNEVLTLKRREAPVPESQASRPKYMPFDQVKLREEERSPYAD